MSDGYYWARHSDGSHFVVLREGNYWYCCGITNPLADFHESQIIMRISWPVN